MIQDLTRDDMICKGRRCMFLFAVYMAIYMLIYGFLLLRLAPLWDEVYDMCGEGMDSYVVVKRWGLAAYRAVFGLGFQPYISGVVAGLYICTALILQTVLLRFASIWQALIYGAVYMCSIQWAYQVVFSEQSDAVAFALLCATVSAFLFSGKCNIWRMAGMVAGIVVCVSIYQATLFYFVALVVARALRGTISFGGLCRLAVQGACAIAVALVLNSAISLIVETCWTYDVSNIDFLRAYPNSLSAWPEIMNVGSIGSMLKSWMYWEVVNIEYMWTCMSGKMYTGQWVYVGTLIPLIGLCTMRRRLWCWHNALYLLLLVLPYAFYPLLLFLRSGGCLAGRIMVAEPIAMGFMWAAFLGELRGRVPSRHWFSILGIFGSVVCFTLLKGSYRVSQMAKDEIHTQELGFAQIREMGTRARLLAEQAGMRECRILVLCPSLSNFDSSRTRLYNAPVSLATQSDSVIYSKGAFEFMYADYAGESSISMGSEEDYNLYRDVLKTMPYWPAPGSMRACRGFIIVKVKTQ